MIYDLVLKNRSYRRFEESYSISQETLLELVDLARLSSSGGNLQSLKYVLSCTEDKNNLIFPHLKWAGYLKDWDGPSEGERPSAYIVIVGDKRISHNFFWDHGIASQSILLGACEKGLGGCMFAAVDKASLKETLHLGEEHDILVVIALGKPKEIVVLEEVSDPKDIKYWRDDKGVHHVPKRKLEDIIIF